MSRQTIEQQRAAHALEAVQKAKKIGRKFTSLANGLPTMVHVNGLGQTIAFCMGKPAGDKQYGEIANMLSAWLCGKGRPFEGTRPQDILTTITSRDMHTYRLAQVEAMAYLAWVKKFAKALIGEEKEGDDGKTYS